MFHEVRQLLKTALELRRKYMDISLQGFCRTTENMLDKKLPPSSAFCVPDVLGGAKFTAAGDIMSSELPNTIHMISLSLSLPLPPCLCVCVCVCVLGTIFLEWSMT